MRQVLHEDLVDARNLRSKLSRLWFRSGLKTKQRVIREQGRNGVSAGTLAHAQKHPAGLVSARVVANVCQIFTWSMMTNVGRVTVLCIDVKGLLQHVVHENNEKHRCDFHVQLLRSLCFVQKNTLFHPPASSSQSVRQLMTQHRQKIVFILVPAPLPLSNGLHDIWVYTVTFT